MKVKAVGPAVADGGVRAGRELVERVTQPGQVFPPVHVAQVLGEPGVLGQVTGHLLRRPRMKSGSTR